MKKKNNKALIIILAILAAIVLGFVLLVLLILFAYSDDDNDDDNGQTEYAQETDYENENQVTYGPTNGKFSTWTVMLYLCGSDLESENEHASENLIEILERESSDKVNILVETGGAEKWHMQELAEDDTNAVDIDPDSLGYYRMDGDVMKLEKTEPLASMGDPQTLFNFITWAAEDYPADRYMLILWDHGGGSAKGVCYDELFDDDCLTLPEIRKAVTGANVPFEIVGFDACLMATLETAEMLHGYGHYMVASQEVIPGSGWSYTDFLSYLSTDPSMDGLKLGKRIGDGYMEKCKERDSDEMATLSVTDLTRIPELSSTYKNLSGELVLCTTDTTSLRTISQEASKTESYGGDSDSQGYSNLIDLGDLISRTDNVLNQNAESVRKALGEAVRYEVHGNSRTGSNGLSVFYPIDASEYEIDNPDFPITFSVYNPKM